MTLAMKAFDPCLIGSLYSARRFIITERTRLLRKFGNPPSRRVSFSTIEDKGRVRLDLQHSKFIDPTDKQYVDKIVESQLVNQ